jgi:hypothetical protein
MREHAGDGEPGARRETMTIDDGVEHRSLAFKGAVITA